jgi:lipoprotein-anchoring transpeptidase ErfK/SrfK
VLFGLAMCVSSVAPSASASLIIKVDKSTQTLTVTRNGKTLHTWPVSTGTSTYATPSGSFTPFRMEADHRSKEWDGAPMPHAVFFTKQGHAIHGSYHIKRLGRPASHGCVRLAPGNAARLFSLVKREGLSRLIARDMGTVIGRGAQSGHRKPKPTSSMPRYSR